MDEDEGILEADGIPVEGTPEYDEMINEQRRENTANWAMFGLLAHYGWHHDGKLIAAKSVEYADALIAALDRRRDDASE